MSTNRVVILGASGFLGKALAPVLMEKAVVEVHGFSSAQIDLTKRKNLEQLNSIVNANSIIIFLSVITPDRQDGKEAAEKNIQMVSNVAEYLSQHPVKKCVYSSSSAVYGNLSGDAIDENTQISLETDYARSKWEGEQILQQVTDSLGIELVILRPVAIFGPQDTHTSYGITRFVRSLLIENQIILYGDGMELRDHLYIKDFAKLAVEFSLGQFSGIYNLATGNSYTFVEIVEFLKEVTDIELRLRSQPRTMPLIHQKFNIAKLKDAFPTYSFTDTRLAIRETYQFFQQRIREKQHV